MATKFCFTCNQPLVWIKREGVGKFNGFWDCPAKCKVKFNPNAKQQLNPKIDTNLNKEYFVQIVLNPFCKVKSL